MTNAKKRTIAAIAVVLLVFLDFITKRLALAHLEGGDYVIWDKVLRFSLVHNKGAVFGMFEGASLILAILTLVILAVVIVFYDRIPVTKRLFPLRAICIFVIAGAIGNLIDRIAYGFVVDFIYIELIDFYIFNVADIYITVSLFFALLFILFKYKDKDFKWLKRKASAEDDEVSQSKE
ncbi:MAG: signal peptidase II [Lachnospiraceae bacterium]|nr:signal peptidase II [Lachnospiraceae bacterium]